MNHFIVAGALVGLLHSGCYDLGYGPDVVYGHTTPSGDPVYYAVSDYGQYLPWYWSYTGGRWTYAPYGHYRDIHDDYGTYGVEPYDLGRGYGHAHAPGH